jgi:hypothetical protein
MPKFNPITALDVVACITLGITGVILFGMAPMLFATSALWLAISLCLVCIGAFKGGEE